MSPIQRSWMVGIACVVMLLVSRVDGFQGGRRFAEPGLTSSQGLQPGHVNLTQLRVPPPRQSESERKPAPPSSRQPDGTPPRTRTQSDSPSKIPAQSPPRTDRDRPPSTPRVNETQPPVQPSRTTAQQSPFAAALRQPPGRRPFLARLRRAPDLFGDSFLPVSATINTADRTTFNNPNLVNVDIPLGGGNRRFKNEHSRALPTDRVFVLFHRFHNAIEFDRPAGDAVPSIDDAVSRVTLGFEATLFDGDASVEVRLPLSDRFRVNQPDLSMEARGLGDLSVAFKSLIAAGEDSALALGVAASVPTGSDVTGSYLPSNPSTFAIQNGPMHLIPFLALQAAPAEQWFFHSFVQVDFPTGGIPVTVNADPLFGGGQFRFKLTEQTFLYADTAVGYWFARNEQADVIRGIAGLLELHYTTALDSADTVTVDNGVFVFGNRQNRMDVLNLTAGLHVELSRRTHLRAAAVVPLRQEDNRFFDTEFTLAIIKRL